MTPEAVVVDYGSGNVRSLCNAVERIGASAAVSSDPGVVAAAPRLLVPGQGEARAAMTALRSAGLDDVIRRFRRPLLGVCIGMQLLYERSEEGDTECLGILPGTVGRFTGDVKVPHTGWNALVAPHGPLFEGVTDGDHVYFVHGFRAAPDGFTTATARHAGPFAAAVSRDNYHGVQFHPEKSGPVGARILANFLGLPA